MSLIRFTNVKSHGSGQSIPSSALHVGATQCAVRGMAAAPPPPASEHGVGASAQARVAGEAMGRLSAQLLYLGPQVGGPAHIRHREENSFRETMTSILP